MEHGLKDSGARVQFADAERLDRLARCTDPPRDLAVLAVRAAEPLAPGVRSLEDALAGVAETSTPRVALDPDDDATIIYTSGSTGHPKGAVSSHRNIISALLSWELDARIAGLLRGIDLAFAKAAPNTGGGMRETNAVGTGISGRDYLDRPEGSGRCSAVLGLRIVDETGRELPAGTRAELQVRGTSVIKRSVRRYTPEISWTRPSCAPSWRAAWLSSRSRATCTSRTSPCAGRLPARS